MPFASIISCADSRVPPEVVFDAGLGDLFVVRLAGNIITDEGTGTVEYAATAFGTSLIMVLGHTSCGAVTATLGVVNNGSVPAGSIPSITRAIEPAVRSTQGQPGDPVDNAARANVLSGCRPSERLRLVSRGADPRGHAAGRRGLLRSQDRPGRDHP